MLEIAEFISPTPSPVWKLAKQAGVDLAVGGLPFDDLQPGTKIYKLPDDMSLRLGSLAEPLTSCIRAFNRAARAGGFKWGDTVAEGRCAG